MLICALLARAPSLFAVARQKILRLSAMIGDVVILILLLIRKRYVVDKVQLQGQLITFGVEGLGCKCDNGLPSKTMRSRMTIRGYSFEIGISGCRVVVVWMLHACLPHEG